MNLSSIRKTPEILFCLALAAGLGAPAQDLAAKTTATFKATAVAVSVALSMDPYVQGLENAVATTKSTNGVWAATNIPPGKFKAILMNYQVSRGPFKVTVTGKDGSELDLNSHFTYTVQTASQAPNNVITADPGKVQGTFDVALVKTLKMDAGPALTYKLGTLGAPVIHWQDGPKSIAKDYLQAALKAFQTTMETQVKADLAKADLNVLLPPLKPAVNKAWNTLAEPRELGNQIWLSFNPTYLSFTSYTCKPQAPSFNLIVKFQMACQPRLFQGRKPEPMPGDPHIESAKAQVDQFSINFNQETTFAQASQAINDGIRGPSAGGGAAGNSGITGLQLKQKNGSLSIQVNVPGPKADIRVAAKPAYNSATKAFELQNVAFEPDAMLPATMDYPTQQALLTQVSTLVGNLLFAPANQLLLFNLKPTAKNHTVTQNVAKSNITCGVTPSGITTTVVMAGPLSLDFN